MSNPCATGYVRRALKAEQYHSHTDWPSTGSPMVPISPMATSSLVRESLKRGREPRARFSSHVNSPL